MPSPNPTPSSPTKPLNDQRKLSVEEFQGALAAIVRGVFSEARAQGVHATIKVTHPGTIQNDGTGKAYIDLSEPKGSEGRWELELSMSDAEPLLFPPLPSHFPASA